MIFFLQFYFIDNHLKKMAISNYIVTTLIYTVNTHHYEFDCTN